MTPEELDKVTGREAWRRWLESRDCSDVALTVDGLREVATIAARLRRESWTPPPVDPDLLAVRRLLAEEFPTMAAQMLAGERDHITLNQRFLAGYKAGKAAR
jgi:hypothetical protein